MTRRERVVNQILGKSVDRIPLMGGWFHGVENLTAIAGISVEEYLANPTRGVIKANEALHVDCMVDTIVPVEIGQIRTGHVTDESFANIEPEELKKRADVIPDTMEQVLAAFDPAVEQEYREYLEAWLPLMGEIVLIPTFWNAPPHFSLYRDYGYEAFLLAVALYPEAVGRIYWEDGIKARARNEILVQLYDEYDLPPILFTGADICNNSGPMCSPKFLREHYFPHVKHAFEPFVNAGVRIVRHCDGNVMPLIDDFINIGYSGFQGFQYECGVDPYEIAVRGKRLLFFAGLNVTRTLPFGTLEDVGEEIEYVLDYTEGGRGLFFFTSNSIGPEVPRENVVFAYNRIANRQYETVRDNASKRRVWPWLTKHPEP